MLLSVRQISPLLRKWVLNQTNLEQLVLKLQKELVQVNQINPLLVQVLQIGLLLSELPVVVYEHVCGIVV